MTPSEYNRRNPFRDLSEVDLSLMEPAWEYLTYAPQEEPLAVCNAMAWIAEVQRLALFSRSSTFFLAEALHIIRAELSNREGASHHALVFSLARRQWARFAKGNPQRYEQRISALLADPEMAKLCCPPPPIPARGSTQ